MSINRVHGKTDRNQAETDEKTQQRNNPTSTYRGIFTENSRKVWAAQRNSQGNYSKNRQTRQTQNTTLSTRTPRQYNQLSQNKTKTHTNSTQPHLGNVMGCKKKGKKGK